MSLSDVLKGAVGNALGQAEQAALPDVMKGVLGTEGLQTILAKLKDAGFDQQVGSWLSQNKDNLPAIQAMGELVSKSAVPEENLILA
jgi:uncharacterized protein YidB (DUF937 family)